MHSFQCETIGGCNSYINATMSPFFSQMECIFVWSCRGDERGWDSVAPIHMPLHINFGGLCVIKRINQGTICEASPLIKFDERLIVKHSVVLMILYPHCKRICRSDDSLVKQSALQWPRDSQHILPCKNSPRFSQCDGGLDQVQQPEWCYQWAAELAKVTRQSHTS